MKGVGFGLSLLVGAALVLTGCSGTTANATPVAAPTIMSPADGLTSVPLTTSFFWLSVNKATYDFQLSTDSSFSNITEQQSNLKNNRYYPTVKLAPVTTYYWRVRVEIRGQAPGYWANAKFTTSPNVTAAHPPAQAGE
jgi:hypothetical protein